MLSQQNQRRVESQLIECLGSTKGAALQKPVLKNILELLTGIKDGDREVCEDHHCPTPFAESIVQQAALKVLVPAVLKGRTNRYEAGAAWFQLATLAEEALEEKLMAKYYREAFPFNIRMFKIV